LWRGKLLGFDYELIKAFAEKNELLIDVIVPPSHEKLIDYVRSGKADIAAGFLSITDGRKQDNVVFSNPYHYASELIVEKKEQGKNMAIDDLSGRTIHVRRSSNYWKTIKQLQKQVAVNLVATPENEETEEAIAKVASGRI
jgi:membrane-bound lytic murein transglycosylase F